MASVFHVICVIFYVTQIWQIPGEPDVKIVPREVPIVPKRVASVFAVKDEEDDGETTIIDKERCVSWVKLIYICMRNALRHCLAVIYLCCTVDKNVLIVTCKVFYLKSYYAKNLLFATPKFCSKGITFSICYVFPLLAMPHVPF